MEPSLKVVLDTGGDLFRHVTFGYDLRKGDLFTYESPSLPKATYKVKSAELEFFDRADTGEGGSGANPLQTILNVVVSIVPPGA